jgi:hypothetical protein
MFQLHSGLFGLVLFSVLLSALAMPMQEFFKVMQAVKSGKMDHTTMVNISVMLYYTPEFYNAVQQDSKHNINGDLNSYIQGLIDLANSAYFNSGIPQKLHTHCIEELNVIETGFSTKQRMDAFARAKDLQTQQECFKKGYTCGTPPIRYFISDSSITCQAECYAETDCSTFLFNTRNNTCVLMRKVWECNECTTCETVIGPHECPSALLNTADMAIQLTSTVTNTDTAAAIMGPWKTTSLKGPPLAWVAPLNCGLCFVHEIGHIMGAQHNREEYPYSKDDYNYDMIKHGKTERTFYNYGMQITGTPYHTIMSYPDNARGLTKWIPRFSRNGVDEDGNRIGDEHNDNSRCLTENRFLMAMVGDESGQCRSDKFEHEEKSAYLVESTALVIVLVYLIIWAMLSALIAPKKNFLLPN